MVECILLKNKNKPENAFQTVTSQKFVDIVAKVAKLAIFKKLDKISKRLHIVKEKSD